METPPVRLSCSTHSSYSLPAYLATKEDFIDVVTHGVLLVVGILAHLLAESSEL